VDLARTVEGEPIYDCAAFERIVEKWPQATQEDARDGFHPDRITVSVPDVSYKEFFLHALDEGYHTVSLTFQFLIMRESETEFQAMVEGWIAERKKHDEEIPENSNAV